MPTFAHLILEYLNALYALLLALPAAIDPVSTLYAMLAATYARAAHAASIDDHKTLARCYVISAVLHGLIGTAHHIGL
jgi:cation transporter-like permease